MATGLLSSSVGVLRHLLTTAWSRSVGWAAGRRLPRPVLHAAVTAYSHALGVDMAEAEVPEGGFETFGRFFARALRRGARTIDRSPGGIVSPCDGELLAASALAAGESSPRFCVKGRRYGVSDLVGDLPEWLGSGREVGSAVIYLSPADYHRVHSPVDGTLRRVRHVAGTHLPVNRLGRLLAPFALVTNERVVFELDADEGPLVLVMVGAIGVSGIEVSVGGAWSSPGDVDLGAGLPVARGDEIGVFNLGSTVVLLWSGAARLEVVPGQMVAMGRSLARRA